MNKIDFEEIRKKALNEVSDQLGDSAKEKVLKSVANIS